MAFNGHSKEVTDLIKILGLPKRCKKFNMECEVDSLLTISCEYYPDTPEIKDGELVKLFKKFKLVEIKEDENLVVPELKGDWRYFDNIISISRRLMNFLCRRS